LKNCGTDKHDIVQYIPINTNIGQWILLAKMLGISFDNVYTKNIKHGAHIVSVDIFRNLLAIEEEMRLDNGDKVLMYAQALGMSFGCMLLEKSI
jgi:3-oxoacyl-[acyl-carrier-protein] synthase III